AEHHEHSSCPSRKRTSPEEKEQSRRVNPLLVSASTIRIHPYLEAASREAVLSENKVLKGRRASCSNRCCQVRYVNIQCTQYQFSIRLLILNNENIDFSTFHGHPDTFRESHSGTKLDKVTFIFNFFDEIRRRAPPSR